MSRQDDFLDRLVACRQAPALFVFEALAEDAIDAFIAAAARADAAEAALQQIIDLPCVVPDHPHGGIHPPYLEWTRAAAAARAVLDAKGTGRSTS